MVVASPRSSTALSTPVPEDVPMAEVLRSRAFYMTKSRRVTVLGLGVNLVYRDFRFVEGHLTVDGQDLPVYYVGAKRFNLGTTPASLFIAVFSLDPPGRPGGGDDGTVTGVASLRVTVTNTPAPLGGEDSADLGDQFTIEVPEVPSSNVDGVPNVPAGGD
jgi:hypothetical protein